MATQNDSTFREGQSTTRPPYFDGNDYPYWKTRMRIYLQALDYEIWEIVNDGPFMPLTKNEVGEDIPKPSRDWNEFKKRKASLNFKAMNALFCALDKKEFHRVSSCESANEIWHKLEVVYEGRTKFTDIVNTLGALGKTFSNSEKVKKIIRSLPKEWRPKMTAIEEAKDLNVLPIDDLIGSLISYKEDLAAEKGHEEKKKNIALKASKRESDEESEMDDEELAMLARRFRKFYKKNNEQRKFRGYKNKKEKKESITCYECKKPGHIRPECPLLNKRKKKAMVATWDDSDEETSDDDEQQEMTNLALMVVGEESCDELDEVSVLPTYDELHDAFKDLHDELMKIDHVYKLSKALYGLKQAPRAWYDRLKNFLLDNDFSMGKADTTLFVESKNQDILIVQIYVDDIIFGSTNELLCKDFSSCMSQEFEMSMMGELKYFLGLQIKQNEEGIFINQAKYVKDLLKRFGYDNGTAKNTPISTTMKLDNDEKGKEFDIKTYRGKLAGTNRIFGFVNLEIRIRAALWQHFGLIRPTGSGKPVSQFSLAIFWIQPASRIMISGKPDSSEGLAGHNRNSGSSQTGKQFTGFKLLVTTDYPSIVLPRLGHLDEVSHIDVVLIDCILRHRPVDLGYTIVRNMLSIPKLITRSLPYGHFITRILKFFDVPIKEPSCRPSKGIGDDAIVGLGFEWKNGTWGQRRCRDPPVIASAPDVSASVSSPPRPPTSGDVTLQQLMDEVRTLSVRQTEFQQEQQQQLIHGQRLLFEHFGIPYSYPPPSPPSSPPE
ncbi:hypothetical protein KPL70_008287 [Citrus sinensis]|nr:hypothetical protein KPL70_008287 [Citrus sinensis]